MVSVEPPAGSETVPLDDGVSPVDIIEQDKSRISTYNLDTRRDRLSKRSTKRSESKVSVAVAHNAQTDCVRMLATRSESLAHSHSLGQKQSPTLPRAQNAQINFV